MTVRSVVISFFIISFSFGMVITNTVNSQWNSDFGYNFKGPIIKPYLGYGDVNIPTTSSAMNATEKDLTTFNKPSDIQFNFDFFQSLKYGAFLISLLFNTVFGFFMYLGALQLIPAFLVIPLTIWLGLNHILAIIYIVTGRTFIY